MTINIGAFVADPPLKAPSNEDADESARETTRRPYFRKTRSWRPVYIRLYKVLSITSDSYLARDVVDISLAYISRNYKVAKNLSAPLFAYTSFARIITRTSNARYRSVIELPLSARRASQTHTFDSTPDPSALRRPSPQKERRARRRATKFAVGKAEPIPRLKVDANHHGIIMRQRVACGSTRALARVCLCCGKVAVATGFGIKVLAR